MLQRKLLVGITTLGLAAGGSAVAAAATASAPKHTTINAVINPQFRINRYFGDPRWQQDVYSVKSGGTITIKNLSAQDGPHTFSVVKKSDLPRTFRQINNCKICGTLAQEHGANQQTGQVQFLYVENGKGTNTKPNIDQAGDSAFIAPTQRAQVTLKVTAKPGTTLYFMCAVHPWMQAKLLVGK